MVEAHVRAVCDVPDKIPSLAEARRHCMRLARGHYENFTVLSPFAPASMRRHLGTLYAYCRTVDDLGDEATGNRLALLDRAENELDAAFSGDARLPVFVALQDTIARFSLPRDPFRRLIDANRRDQAGLPFETFSDLLDYCACSANPVGRLVLMIHGCRDEEALSLSDATCTALQLTNFWQDLRRDARRGRVYLPQEDMKTLGVRPHDLVRERASDDLKELIRFQVGRARAFFEEGLPLLRRVRGHLRVDLALFSLGGLAILDKIEAQGFDTLSQRPLLTSSEKLRLGISALTAKRWRRN